MSAPTFCDDCDFVDNDSRKRHPSLWLCTRHPRIEGMGFVQRGVWSNGEPFLRCRDVNGGACMLWGPLRTTAPATDEAA